MLDMVLVRTALKKLGFGLEKMQDNNFDFCARNVALKAFSLNKFQWLEYFDSEPRVSMDVLNQDSQLIIILLTDQ